MKKHKGLRLADRIRTARHDYDALAKQQLHRSAGEIAALIARYHTELGNAEAAAHWTAVSLRHAATPDGAALDAPAEKGAP